MDTNKIVTATFYQYPNMPNNPSPVNNATNISNLTLSWSGGTPNSGDTVTYNVYVGTTSVIPLVSQNQTATTYVLNWQTFPFNTTYYWRIEAISSNGLGLMSPAWQFTTTSTTTSTIPPTQNPIIYNMPAGSLAGSWVTYSNYLTSGQEFKGTVSLSGFTPSIDWSSTWTFSVYDPENNLVDRKAYTFSDGAVISFDYTASHAGNWAIRVDHASFYSRTLHLIISPTGWSRIGNFP